MTPFEMTMDDTAGAAGSAPKPAGFDAFAPAVSAATARIAPVWPLRGFVAVNPFLGLSEMRFDEACGALRRLAGADMLMPRQHFAAALAEGKMTEGDLAQALDMARAEGRPGLPSGVADILAALSLEPGAPATPVPTLADAAGLGATTAEAIGRWAAAYWDEGQASWRLPWRALLPFAAWKAMAETDLTLDAVGVPGFRGALATLPRNAKDALAIMLTELDLAEEALEAYLARALFSVAGWAAFARQKAWVGALYQTGDETPTEFLAIRIAHDWALMRAGALDATALAAWREDVVKTAAIDQSEVIAIDILLQDALDSAHRRGLIQALSTPSPVPATGAPARKMVQAAFCIDVRSEVFRRALESCSDEIETIGFAGFFGFAIEYVPLGQDVGGAQCPVLLKPSATVRETVLETPADDRDRAMSLRMIRRRAAKAWASFKLSAVSSFAFVETAGPLYLGKLIGNALGLTRPVAAPNADGLDAAVAAKLGPSIEAEEFAGRMAGFDAATRLTMAETVLKAMSMTDNLARLVLLAGHGSTTVNNPHAAGLDCGACGGHTGEANARVAAFILNDRDVRVGLAAKGIQVPEDCWFVAGLHDTTTDAVTLYDTDAVPPALKGDLKRLEAWLDKAGKACRAERARFLGLVKGEDVDQAVKRKSTDWSEVRPEWGLAGNAAFIAAPRARTKGLNLAGRAFLHSYDWRQDTGFGVLELILSAPVVVASWINLQYYGSTVNNRLFGSGNKVLHNVVGTVGVLEGNGGDLRTGLPWQSLHDGTSLIHEPLRLSVFVEAPTEAMTEILDRHPGVRQLFAGNWIALYALDDQGRPAWRYANPAEGWVAVA